MPAFSFDVIEPCVFHPFTSGPDVLLCGDGAGVTANTFYRDSVPSQLRAYFHFSPPVPDPALIIQPVNAFHFPDRDEFIAIRTHGSVIVEAVASCA